MRDPNEWIEEIAAAATRLSSLGALEGAAGNISLFLPGDISELGTLLDGRLKPVRELAPVEGMSLPPGALIVTGSGRRLRDIAVAPDSVLCAISFAADGVATLCRAPGQTVEPTSEIDSHLAVHAAVLGSPPRPHVVIHAQPPRLTYLSHIAAYRDEPRLNRQLLRWQPETIATLPEGLRVLPFETPGTARQGRLTAQAMRAHRLVVWAKHGVVARSHDGPSSAADMIDYVESAAGYELADLLAGRPADGLSLSELRAITARFGVSSALLDTLPENLLP